MRTACSLPYGGGGGGGGVFMTETPPDRGLPWTETPWTETPRQRLPGQRPPDREPPDRDPTVDRQTPVKTLPLQTSFAGGKTLLQLSSEHSTCCYDIPVLISVAAVADSVWTSLQSFSHIVCPILDSFQHIHRQENNYRTCATSFWSCSLHAQHRLKWSVIVTLYNKWDNVLSSE